MKWVVVTGGAKRLGASISLELARNGYSIIVHYNKSEKEAQNVVDRCLAQGVNAICIQGDFTHPEGVHAFVEKCWVISVPLYALINNVGNYFLGSALETPLMMWADLFQTNFFAPLLLVQQFRKHLIASKGHVINIGVAGLIKQSANTYATAYALTKEALWSLTRSLAYEMSSDKIKVNMVSPGMLDNSIDLHSSLVDIPMRRPGTCCEVARMVSFLLDSQSEYITGQNIEIAGGVGLK